LSFWFTQINFLEFHLRLAARPFWVWTGFFLHGLRLWIYLIDTIYRLELFRINRNRLV